MTIKEIKLKVQYGDYTTLADMLEIKNAVTAKMRFVRGNEEARQAMESIVTGREKLIAEFKKEHKS